VRRALVEPAFVLTKGLILIPIITGTESNDHTHGSSFVTVVLHIEHNSHCLSGPVRGPQWHLGHLVFMVYSSFFPIITITIVSVVVMPIGTIYFEQSGLHSIIRTTLTHKSSSDVDLVNSKQNACCLSLTIRMANRTT